MTGENPGSLRDRLARKFRKARHLLVHNPGEFWRALRNCFLSPPHPKSGIHRVNGIRFEIDLDLDPAMQAMFTGDYERNLAQLIQRILRPGDTFLDVGANVGYLTAVALGAVGKQGTVHSFEPVPRYFNRLQSLQNLNPDRHLFLHHVAVGSQPGTAQIAVTNLQNIGWNTMVPGFMPPETVRETISVPVVTLDEVLADQNLSRLRLVKIDTEGFEFPAIQGFHSTLRNLSSPPVLIVEVAVGAFPLLNCTLADFAGFMSNLGYIPHTLDLSPLPALESLDKTTDVVFLPSHCDPREFLSREF